MLKKVESLNFLLSPPTLKRPGSKKPAAESCEWVAGC